MKPKTGLILTFISLFMFVFGFTSYSQRNEGQLKIERLNDGNYLISFNILGIKDISHSNAIITKIKSRPEILSCVITELSRCEIISSQPISSEYVIEAMQTQKVGFGNIKLVGRQDGMPDNFPVYKNTGDSAKDDKDYDEAKARWIQENRAVYDQMTIKAQSINQK